MRRCAFLTLADPTGQFIDDPLAYGPMAELGWRVEAVPWSEPRVSWRDFEVVVIRSPWDYSRHVAAFLAVLETIERSGTRLLNGLELVRWNLSKSYLAELATRGVPVVPTRFLDRLAPGQLETVFREQGEEAMVLKPMVGTNADGAFRLDRRSVVERASEVESHFATQALLVQPMVRAVVDEGEYSLFYFNGELSHAILKTPKSGDFRVQEDHGGILRRVDASAALREAAAAALAPLAESPLYARVDLVRSNDHAGFWLMELELIEPSLYLRLDPEAPVRFARAIDARCRG